MDRRVPAVATFCFALVIGLLLIVSSRRPHVEPKAAPAAPAGTVGELGTLRIDADVAKAQVFIGTSK